MWVWSYQKQKYICSHLVSLCLISAWKSIAKYTLKQKYVCTSHLNGDTKTKKYQSQESWHNNKQLLFENKEDGSGYKNHSPVNTNMTPTSTVNPQPIAHQQKQRGRLGAGLKNSLYSRIFLTQFFFLWILRYFFLVILESFVPKGLKYREI